LSFNHISFKIEFSSRQPLGTRFLNPKKVQNLRKTTPRYQKSRYGPRLL